MIGLHYKHRPPPSSRLWTGTAEARAMTELSISSITCSWSLTTLWITLLTKSIIVVHLHHAGLRLALLECRQWQNVLSISRSLLTNHLKSSLKERFSNIFDNGEPPIQKAEA